MATSSGNPPIPLPARCDLAEAEMFFDRMCDLGADETICLDAGAVEQMSTPFVLALISAMKFREDVKPAAVVENATQPFIGAFQTLGLYRDMMKMEFRT